MNLSIDYLGVQFENPFVLASGPPTASGEMIARAFDAGWAGAVVKTLIKEPVVNLKNRFASIRASGEIIGFENVELLSELTPDKWFEDIRKLKEDYPDKVVIGSIMGDAKERGPWIELAKGCQEAGADMVELNYSCPHGYPEKGKGAAIGQNGEYAAQITKWLATEESLTIPIIPKLTAAVADISYIGQAVADSGADGICAINTFPSIMGVDLETLEPRPSVGGYTTPGGYSGQGLKPIALRCVSDLAKFPGLPVMACGGVTTGSDAAEFILLGAPIVQVCTAVMLDGYLLVNQMRIELEEFMNRHGFSRVEDFLGKAGQNVRSFGDLDSDYSVVAVSDPELCLGCEQCFTSCSDGGFQAIAMKSDTAIIDEEKCTGCSLCYQVCSSGAIQMVEL